MVKRNKKERILTMRITDYNIFMVKNNIRKKSCHEKKENKYYHGKLSTDIALSLSRGRVRLSRAFRAGIAPCAQPPDFATESLSRGRVRITAQPLENKFSRIARMLTLPARKKVLAFFSILYYNT